MLHLAMTAAVTDAPSLAAALAVLAAVACVAFVVRRSLPVVALAVPATAGPAHPGRRASGDVPRQHHPDSPGRSRPRAPGLG